MTTKELFSLYRKILNSSPVNRSIFLSYFLSAPAPKDFIDKALDEGSSKELSALMDTFQGGQEQFSHKYLYGIPDKREYPDWTKDVGSRIASALYNSLRNKSAIFPQVNRIKNVGRHTAYQYSIHVAKSLVDVSTLDLQLLEYHEGRQIQGPTEIRSHFKFNDIKPRIYFAQGGTAYWNARYMKPIAVGLMETIPASSVKNRDDPMYYLNMNSTWEETATMNWDLSSFTSRLQELRHFIFHLTVVLERKHGRCLIKLFDWREGVVQKSLVELLTEYNQSMNYHPEFSFQRIYDEYVQETSMETLVSRNGGLLGVPGNIGFSTALHGIVAERIFGEGNAICVGDDAMGVGGESAFTKVQTDIERLGLIQRDKFEIMTLGKPETKFLKRRVTLSQDGLTIDQYLLSITNPFEALGIIPEGRTSTMMSYYDRCKRVCQTLGSTLWRIHGIFHDEVTDQELNELSRYYRAIYDQLGLPIGGRLGGKIKSPGAFSKEYRLGFVIPSLEFNCRFDPRILDWTEWMLENREIQYIDIPLFSINYIKPVETDLYEGSEFTCTSSPFTRYLEDIDCAVVVKMKETIDLGLFINQRRFLRWLKRIDIGKSLVRVTMKKNIDYAMSLDGLVNVSWTDVSKLAVDTLE